MRRRLTFALTLLMLCMFTGPLAAPAHAYDSFSGVDCSGAAAKSAVCASKTSQDPVAGSNGIIANITDIVAFVAGAAAIIIIILGGIRYITSGGDPAKVKSAKDTVFNALIGIAVIVLARELILFVLSKLK